MIKRGLMGISAFVLGLSLGEPQYATAHTHETYDPLTGVTRTMEYDRECCNKRDCGPVVDIRPGVNERKEEGWWMTNRLVSGVNLKAFVQSKYLDEPHKWMLNGQDSKIRESQDGRWHICIQPNVPKYPGMTTRSQTFPYGIMKGGGGTRPTLASDTTRSIYCVYVPPHMFQGGTKKSKASQEDGDIYGWE